MLEKHTYILEHYTFSKERPLAEGLPHPTSPAGGDIMWINFFIHAENTTEKCKGNGILCVPNWVKANNHLCTANRLKYAEIIIT